MRHCRALPRAGQQESTVQSDGAASGRGSPLARSGRRPSAAPSRPDRPVLLLAHARRPLRLRPVGQIGKILPVCFREKDGIGLAVCGPPADVLQGRTVARRSHRMSPARRRLSTRRAARIRNRSHGLRVSRKDPLRIGCQRTRAPQTRDIASFRARRPAFGTRRLPDSASDCRNSPFPRPAAGPLARARRFSASSPSFARHFGSRRDHRTAT